MLFSSKDETSLNCDFPRAHSHVLMTGGPTEALILYPKKSQLQNLFAQKNHTFLALPKKSHTSSKLRSSYCLFELMKGTNPEKSLCFFATQENPGVFHRLPKISFGQNFRPKKILRTPLLLKYVRGKVLV